MFGTDRTIDKGFTNNPYINGILWSGERLPRNRITYSFINNRNSWGSEGVEKIEAALDTWESVADIEFVRVSNNNVFADFQLKLEDNSYFASGSANGIALGKFSAPGEPDQGEGVFNVDELGKNVEFSLDPGEEGFKVLIHEFGHGLGLGHPHDTSGNSSTTFPLVTNRDASDLGLYGLNQGVWTTMSYNNGYNDRGFESTPMALDIAAIQHLYGANEDFASGDNVYRLSDLESYTAIWDTDGEDTITAIGVGFGVAANIDLRDAPLTGANAGGYISSATGEDTGLTIANGVEIENATGGLYHDTLTGNEFANTLNGNGGNDLLVGLTGSDTLLGGYGDDVLIGVSANTLTPGRGEYDFLTGGGATDDLFVLGDRNRAFYQGYGFATITDFDRTEGDKLQVHGSSKDYTFTDSLGGIDIEYKDDLIGFIENTTALNPLLDVDYL